MSFFRFFYTVCVFVVVSMSAGAVQRCVALNSDTICDVVYAAQGDSNFVLGCTGEDGHTFEVLGIGICSPIWYSVLDSTEGVALEDVPMMSGATDSRALGCGCKLIEPVESKWVYAGMHMKALQSWQYGGITCSPYCGQLCAEAVVTGGFENGMAVSDLASKLFGNLL